MESRDIPSPVLLTGATGFVGSHILHRLLAQGYHVHALVRKPRTLNPPHPHITEFVGSVTDPASLRLAATGCASAIHLVGIIDEKHSTFEEIHVAGTRNVLDALKKNGDVEKYVHMSALGTRPAAASRYHQTKWQAEEAVRESGLPYTIFRPSLIFGRGGEFSQMLKDWSLGKSPPYFFMPFFGQGLLGQSNANRLQPMHIENVVSVFIDALTNPVTLNKTYDIAGPDTFSWRELLTTASRIFRGTPKIAIGIPAWYAKLLASLPLPLPFNKDQVIMSQEDNTADIAPMLRDFPELTLKRFAETLEA